MISRYSMVIRWSEEDQTFIVRLPEFGNALTDGQTYAAAVKQGQELIESFLMWYAQDAKPLPVPRAFDLSSDCGCKCGDSPTLLVANNAR